MLLFIDGDIKISMILATGDNNDIGRYDDDSSAGLFGFNNGITLAVFQIGGTINVLIDKFIVVVRNEIPNTPSFFSINGAKLSGPIAFDGFILLIACLTSSKLNVKSTTFLLLEKFLSVFLMCLSVNSGCSVNCLLNSAGYWLSRSIGLPLNEIMVFGFSLHGLFKPLMVFHKFFGP